MKRCKSGKVTHPSRGKAEAHLRGILKLAPDYDGSVYPCPRCSGWHVGSRESIRTKPRVDKVLREAYLHIEA